MNGAYSDSMITTTIWILWCANVTYLFLLIFFSLDRMNGTFHFTNLSMAYNEVYYCH